MPSFSYCRDFVRTPRVPGHFVHSPRNHHFLCPFGNTSSRHVITTLAAQPRYPPLPMRPIWPGASSGRILALAYTPLGTELTIFLTSLVIAAILAAVFLGDALSCFGVTVVATDVLGVILVSSRTFPGNTAASSNAHTFPPTNTASRTLLGYAHLISPPGFLPCFTFSTPLLFLSPTHPSHSLSSTPSPHARNTTLQSVRNDSSHG